MPSNDTDNIYATQYGGEGEPIPATKISYNNTSSGLSATKVQGAIDELAEEKQDKLTGEWYVAPAIPATKQITTTVNTIADDLATAFNAMIAELADTDDVYEIVGVESSPLGFGFLQPVMPMYLAEDTTLNLYQQFQNINASKKTTVANDTLVFRNITLREPKGLRTYSVGSTFAAYAESGDTDGAVNIHYRVWHKR